MIDFSRKEIHGLVGSRLRRVAGQIPDRPAIHTPRASLTFAELDRASDDLARAILARRGSAEEPVALLLEQGADSVLATLGIIKAGKSAVVLDPGFPLSRLSAIWEDAQKPLVVTDSLLAPRAAELTQQPESWMDITVAQDRSFDLDSIHPRPETLAALFYTSGTTGEPKGVMISNELILHNAWYNFDRYRITEKDRLALVASHGFSASLSLALCTILAGATLHLRDSQDNQLTTLIEWLRRDEITILFMPSLAMLQKQSTSAPSRVSLPHLRAVLFGSDAIHRETLQQLRDFFPESTEFSYRMGSTETMMMFELGIRPGAPIPWEKIPVGRVIPDQELMLLDDAGRPVAPGAVGEIAIRSKYLADGYWRKPDATRARFLPDPENGDRRIHLTGDLGRVLPDGLLEHLGRKDNLVRVRGFSIQLESVEKALQNIPGVSEAATAVVQSGDGGKRLVGYVVRSEGTEPSVGRIIKRLAIELPAHMIPTAYVFLDAIPRTPSNRVNRQLLPPPGTERPDIGIPYAGPRTDLERELCSLWAKIIGVDQVGVNDDFFLLGGDSLLAMHMVLQVEESLHRKIPSDFFRNSTISSLIHLWNEGEPAAARSAAPEGGSLLRSARPNLWPGRKSSRRRKGTEIKWLYQYKPTPIGYDSLPLPVFIPRFIAEYVPLFLSYSEGLRWISRWSRSSRVIRLFYPAEAKLFRSWVDSLGGCPDAPNQALSINIIGSILWSQKYKARIPIKSESDFLLALQRSSAPFLRDGGRIIAGGSAEEFDHFFAAEGLEYIREPIQQGKGIILVSFHSQTNRFSTIALPRRLQVAPFPTLSLSQAKKMEPKEHRKKGWADNQTALIANATVEAHRLLQRGGLIQVVPDLGYNAADGLPVNIAGRRYLIKQGFAELALLSQAVVIPIYSTRRIDGSILTRFDPPFDLGKERMDRSARIDHLLNQYAAFLERSWRAAPESIRWQGIDAHLHRPLTVE